MMEKMMKATQRRERLEKQFYKEHAKGNYEKASQIMQKMVDLDVQIFAWKNA